MSMTKPFALGALVLAVAACSAQTTDPPPHDTSDRTSETPAPEATPPAANAGEKEETSGVLPPEVTEAADAEELVKQQRALAERGWTFAPNTSAKVTSEPGRIAVAFGATRETFAIDLVYTKVDGEIDVVVRARDEASNRAVTEDINAIEGNPPAMAAASGCGSQTFSCYYRSSEGWNWGCVQLWGNPTGHYYITTVRTGYSDRRSCLGWYADYRGNTVVCPYPNSSYSWHTCGF